MTDGYAFHASHAGLVGGMRAPYHGISVFRAGDKPPTDDPNAPCVWSSAAAGQALAESGYTRGGERAFQRGRLQQYRRTSCDGATVFYADLLTYLAGGAAADTCVYEVRFAGMCPSGADIRIAPLPPALRVRCLRPTVQTASLGWPMRQRSAPERCLLRRRTRRAVCCSSFESGCRCSRLFRACQGVVLGQRLLTRGDRPI